ncbi:hypothetical protein CYMTET_42213 [Cymbomonas tetramitiformis]|uniref:Uncharacterized protein n=1 Tax=Cymbomonas tetramitiformis TaxID=36881 RepID=A0AAE0F178_9CHLO|nr:hypothetical protein CYMTET_42213 [Cymbomonas tetramitiformis]
MTDWNLTGLLAEAEDAVSDEDIFENYEEWVKKERAEALEIYGDCIDILSEGHLGDLNCLNAAPPGEMLPRGQVEEAQTIVMELVHEEDAKQEREKSEVRNEAPSPRLKSGRLEVSERAVEVPPATALQQLQGRLERPESASRHAAEDDEDRLRAARQERILQEVEAERRQIAGKKLGRGRINNGLRSSLAPGASKAATRAKHKGEARSGLVSRSSDFVSECPALRSGASFGTEENRPSSKSSKKSDASWVSLAEEDTRRMQKVLAGEYARAGEKGTTVETLFGLRKGSDSRGASREEQVRHRAYSSILC